MQLSCLCASLFVYISTYSPTCSRVSVCLHVCMCLDVFYDTLGPAGPAQWPSPLGGFASCCCPPAPPGSQGETECEVVCLAML